MFQEAAKHFPASTDLQRSRRLILPLVAAIFAIPVGMILLNGFVYQGGRTIIFSLIGGVGLVLFLYIVCRNFWVKNSHNPGVTIFPDRVLVFLIVPHFLPINRIDSIQQKDGTVLIKVRRMLVGQWTYSIQPDQIRGGTDELVSALHRWHRANVP